MSETNSLPALGFAANMTDEERAVLGSYGEAITANEGDVLIQEDQPQDSLFLIIFGQFHVQTTKSGGRPILLGSLKAGDTVGEINMFDPANASASVVAKSLAQAWRIDRASLENYLEENSAAAARLLVEIATQLSHRLRMTNDKVAVTQGSQLG